ncbi:MAG: NAD(P)H-dependent oxidoreductase subunit E [Planctomycetota bacterium]
MSQLLAALSRDPAPFPLLRGLLAARRAGHALDEVACRRFAETLGRPLEQVTAVADFVGSLGDRARLRVCVGVSCRVNGAASLHESLAADPDCVGPRDELHCLNNCDRGPSLSCGDRIYSGSSEEVRVEERSWREDPVQRG